MKKKKSYVIVNINSENTAKIVFILILFNSQNLLHIVNLLV